MVAVFAHPVCGLLTAADDISTLILSTSWLSLPMQEWCDSKNPTAGTRLLSMMACGKVQTDPF
jgi:hypothetical protein